MAGDVRQPIDVVALSKFLDSHVPEIKTPITLKQFGYGQSNPTYQVIASDGRRYVLRKRPPGTILSRTAHRVDREYRIIHALRNTNVPVPQTLCLCEDSSVLGTSFYIMEFLEGRIFEDASIPGVSATQRQAMWHDAIRSLAKLHALDPEAIGLKDFGKPTHFYNRQIRTFRAISKSQAETMDVETHKPVGEIPHFDDIVDFLQNPDFQPIDRGTLIHGDYKIDNIVFHQTEPRVIGILDWEMSTVGHPLSDLCNILSPYSFAVNPPNEAMSSRANPKFKPSAQTVGLPSREQCVEWYSDTAEWDPSSEVEWGDVFANFRNSVIMQGIAARHAQRQASSERAREIGSMMHPYGQFCWGLVQRCQSKSRDRRRAKM